MGYKKQEWSKGDTISSEKLNAMEKGIEEAYAPETWGNIKNKPSKFTPSDHTHPVEDIDGLLDNIKKLEDRIETLESLV